MSKARKHAPAPRRRTGKSGGPAARAGARPKPAAAAAGRHSAKTPGAKSKSPSRQPRAEGPKRIPVPPVGDGAVSRGARAPFSGPASRATEAERGTELGRYVYCIIQATQPLRFGAIGMDERWPDVYTINFREMAAVVSDVSIEAPLDSTRENVLAHERVNESVMREHTVIPMSFGTIFRTHEDIVELLRSAYEAFAEVLAKMEDKLEFGLKVLWDRDEIVRTIEQEDEDIHRLKSEIASQQGSTYFARMQYGRLIDAALQQRSERYGAELLRQLRDVAVASRVNRAIGDKMIMNVAFLVRRDQEPAFDQRIKEIASRFDKLTFKYTGPWPPYNFVNIRLKLERAGKH